MNFVLIVLRVDKDRWPDSGSDPSQSLPKHMRGTQMQRNGGLAVPPSPLNSDVCRNGIRSRTAQSRSGIGC